LSEGRGWILRGGLGCTVLRVVEEEGICRCMQ
jgi:hypothetical protein